MKTSCKRKTQNKKPHLKLIQRKAKEIPYTVFVSKEQETQAKGILKDVLTTESLYLDLP